MRICSATTTHMVHLLTYSQKNVFQIIARKRFALHVSCCHIFKWFLSIYFKQMKILLGHCRKGTEISQTPQETRPSCHQRQSRWPPEVTADNCNPCYKKTSWHSQPMPIDKYTNTTALHSHATKTAFYEPADRRTILMQGMHRRNTTYHFVAVWPFHPCMQMSWRVGYMV